MSFLQKWPYRLTVLTYVLVSLTPFFPLFIGGSTENLVSIFILEIAVWIIVWAIFKKPFLFHWFLLPAFLFLPVEIYVQKFYGQTISIHHLGLILETNPEEALEFLGYKIWLLLATLSLALIWWYSILKATHKIQGLSWIHPSRKYFLVILIIGLGGLGLINNLCGSDSEKNTCANKPILSSLHFSSFYSAASDIFDKNLWASSRPFGWIALGYDFWKERTYLSKLSEKNKQFTFHAKQSTFSDTPQIMVVVIGESSRYDRWGLNGYQRATTPLLVNEPNILSFSNIITAVSATRLSVPVIVSRKPATQSLHAGFSEKSFLSAFKEAGFKTYWLSNQMSFGQFDTPVSVFAKEADITQFFNLGGFTNESSFDQTLLAPLNRAIQDSAQKKLIVLHTLGNHWNYSHRHPKEFDHWQPSLFGISNPEYTNLKIKQRMNNSYDNSILYTDWLLSQVIQSLKASNQVASMLYVSDHGQTLYDGSCTLAFHGHNTQYEFHIPALVWYSNQYNTIHSSKIIQLHKHKHAKLTTENIFHSLLDFADIHYPNEQLEYSFFSPTFKTHKRYVDSYGWSDYDNSNLKGDCREIIDRRTPITQE